MNMEKPIRVVIVDDHQVFVDALAVRLADEPDVVVVGKAMNTEQALEVLSTTPCDVVTLDLILGEEDGLALGREILRRWPQTGIVVVTGAEGGEMEGSAPGLKLATRFQEAFDRVEAEIHAVPDDALVKVNVDIPTAITTVFGALPSIFCR